MSQFKVRSIGAAKCVDCGRQFKQGEWIVRISMGKFHCYMGCPIEEKEKD